MGSSRSWECIVLLFNVAVEFSVEGPLSLSLSPSLSNFRWGELRRWAAGDDCTRPDKLAVVSAAGQRPTFPPSPHIEMDTMFVCSGLRVSQHTHHGLLTAIIYMYMCVCVYLTIHRHCARNRFVSKFPCARCIETESGLREEIVFFTFACEGRVFFLFIVVFACRGIRGELFINFV